MPIFNINDEKSAEARRGREFKIPFSLKKRERLSEREKVRLAPLAYIKILRERLLEKKKTGRNFVSHILLRERLSESQEEFTNYK